MRISLIATVVLSAVVVASTFAEHKHPLGEKCLVRDSQKPAKWVLCQTICDNVIPGTTDFKLFTSELDAFAFYPEEMSYFMQNLDNNPLWLEYRAQMLCVKMNEVGYSQNYMVIPVSLTNYKSDDFILFLLKGRDMRDNKRNDIEKEKNEEYQSDLHRYEDGVVEMQKSIQKLNSLKNSLDTQQDKIQKKIEEASSEVTNKEKEFAATKARIAEFYKTELILIHNGKVKTSPAAARRVLV
jgi:hypothetical protein